MLDGIPNWDCFLVWDDKQQSVLDYKDV